MSCFYIRLYRLSGLLFTHCRALTIISDILAKLRVLTYCSIFIVLFLSFRAGLFAFTY